MNLINALKTSLTTTLFGALALTARAQNPSSFILQEYISRYAPTNQLSTKTNIQSKFSTQFSATPPASVEEYALAPQGSDGFTLPPVWIDPRMLKDAGYLPLPLKTNTIPSQESAPTNQPPALALEQSLPLPSNNSHGLDALVSAMTSQLPAFPMGYATFDREGKIVGHITRVDYPADPAMARIDTPSEFARFMNVLASAYPGNTSSIDFKSFATTYVSPDFASELVAAGQGYDAAMALMADYRGSLRPENALPGLVVRTNELGYKVTGSLKRIGEVKDRSFRPSREQRSKK